MLERLLHDPPVMSVLLEVHEHHAAVEEGPDQRIPSQLVRERAVAIGKNGLEPVRAKHRDSSDAESTGPEHRSEALVVAPDTLSQDVDMCAFSAHAIET